MADRSKARTRSRAKPKPAATAQKAQSLFSLSEEETEDLGRTLARSLVGGELVLLVGELGMGKTVFVRGMAAGLGIEPADVSSPSFTLIQHYRGGRLPLCHIDLYRLSSDEEIATLGIDEILGTETVVVVEWGERIPPFWRREAITVRFHDVGEGCRQIELRGKSEAAPKRKGDA